MAGPVDARQLLGDDPEEHEMSEQARVEEAQRAFIRAVSIMGGLRRELPTSVVADKESSAHKHLLESVALRSQLSYVWMLNVIRPEDQKELEEWRKALATEAGDCH